jgi:hypothetical protein
MADDEPASSNNKYDQRITQSVNDLRSNAKWALVAFGAIGTTLLAGSQLSSIGRFTCNDPRLWLALVCAGAALLAAAAAVYVTLRVANAGYTEITDRTAADDQFVAHNPFLLEGFGTVDNLLAWYDAAIDRRFGIMMQDPIPAADLDNIEGWLRYLDGVVDNVTSLIRYNRIKRQSDAAKTVLIAATLIAAIAILGFAWAANPKADQPIVVMQSPTSQARLTLTEEGKRALAPLLGAACVAQDHVDVIVLSLGPSGNDVVSVKSKDCKLARFSVGDTLGKITPASATP